MTREEVVLASRQQFQEIADHVLHNDPISSSDMQVSELGSAIPLPGQPIDEIPRQQTAVGIRAVTASQSTAGPRDSRMRPLVLATSERYRKEMAKMMGLPSLKK
jgi:hypothetical protein